MTKYNYTRTLDVTNNCYDINNKDRVDGSSNQIYLVKEIKVAIPNKHFNIICNGLDVVIDFFNYTLSGGEETTLNTIVSNHKNDV